MSAARSRRAGLAVLAALAFSPFLAGTGEPLGAPPVPGSYRLPCIESAADGKVVTSQGAPTTLHRLYAGKIAVLSLIYTACSDSKGCPWATFMLSQTAKRLDADPRIAARVRFVSLSFDAARDTPEVMARYGKPFSRDIDWAFVTTRSPEALAPILTSYDQRLMPDPGAAGGFAHLLRVFLIDEGGYVRNTYSASFLDPVLLANDITTLAGARGAACAPAGP